MLYELGRAFKLNRIGSVETGADYLCQLDVELRCDFNQTLPQF